MENVFTRKDPLLDVINQVVLGEKKLTDAELKKREEIAQAIERENPGMDMGKKMAIATAQAKKVAEEVEQIEEDNNDLGDMHDDAYEAAKKAGIKPHSIGKHPKHPHLIRVAGENGKGVYNRKTKTFHKGIDEEVEQIDEISAELATKVQKAHAAKSIRHALTGNKSKSAEHITRAIHASIYAEKRKANPKAPINVSSKEMEHKANKLGLKTEEAEQIDEADEREVSDKLKRARDYEKVVNSRHNSHAHTKEIQLGVAKDMLDNAHKAVNKTRVAKFLKTRKGDGKVRTEEVELNLDEQLENFWGAYLTCLDEAKDDASQQALLLRAMAKDPSDLMKMKRAIAMGDKALTNPVMRQEILKMLDQMMNLTVTDKALLQKTRSSFMKQKQFKTVDTTNTEEYVPEEVEELDELSKGTLGNYIKKAATGMNGMAVHAHMSGSASSAEQREKHFDKAFKRGKGIAKAADKLTKEEVEQIDELSKGTLGSYVKKATSDVVNKAVGYSHDAAKVSSKAPPTRTDSDYDKLRVGERGLAKRRKGIDLAVKKLTKEEAEQVDEAGYDFTHYRKMQYAQTRAAQKADDKPPFEGGREVKSSKPAAERVKKIAKGMQKKYTKKD